LTWVFISCQDSFVDIQSYDFYPVKLPKSKIYQVKEQIFEINDDPSINTYYLKETITNIEAKPNEESFFIERSKSKDGLVWKIDSVWIGRKTPSEVVISENNIEKVKLIFPVRENTKFNINKYNSSGSDEAIYLLKKEPFSLNDQKLENLITVVISDDSTLIDKHKTSETYAPQIGLVNKTLISLEYCQASPGCIGKGIISRGIIYEQVLKKTEN
jgi:hypothetical protein